MATTYPLPTLAATITATGITAPAYSDVLASLQASFQLIYGADAYFGADSQDGQLLAIFAKAISDCNQAAIAAYNAFSPATASGVGLSSVVKINNITRGVPTNSQVNVTLTGVAGTTITNGIVGDSSGNRWFLPSIVTIPPGGLVLVTATAEKQGAITALANTVNQILTPTSGWQSANNPNPAVPGSPIESDAELRARQEISPALNAYTVSSGLAAALKALPGVTYGTIYENDTNTTDTNGLPPHSISCVVQGGDVNAIANTIYQKKGQGVATYGSTTVNITDISGAVRPINFYIPTEIAIKVQVTLVAGTSYTTNVATEIKNAVAAYINGLDIGEDLVVNRLYVPALLSSAIDSETYQITALTAGLLSGSLGTANVVVAYNNKATCLASNVTLVVS